MRFSTNLIAVVTTVLMPSQTVETAVLMVSQAVFQMATYMSTSVVMTFSTNLAASPTTVLTVAQTSLTMSRNAPKCS